MVRGYDFDPDDFLERSGLAHPTLRVRHKGEPLELARPSELWKHSQFALDPSEADFDHFQDQVADVIVFLKANAEPLSHILNINVPYQAYFDFPIHDRYNVAQEDYLSPELLRLTGNLNIGIIISRYPNHKGRKKLQGG
jgi:hypothetical protein